MISFLDVELVPEYLRPDVIRANGVLASYHEVTELLTEGAADDSDMSMESFVRLLAQQRLTFDEYQRRSHAIIAHVNHEADCIAQRLGLTD